VDLSFVCDVLLLQINYVRWNSVTIYQYQFCT